MPQSRKNLVIMVSLLLLMVLGAVAVRQVVEWYTFAPFFDVGVLLGMVGVSFAWERGDTSVT